MTDPLILTLRERYMTHDMSVDGVADYGWLDGYNTSLDGNVSKCRVCQDSILTIVDVGAICRQCRLTGGYNSGRFVK